MKTFSKLLSILLMFALLVTSFAFLASANGDPFEATATIEDAANADDAVSSDEGDILYGTASLNNWDSNAISAHKVTPAGSDNSYLMLKAVANKTTGNHYAALSASAAVLDFETDFYVIEADIASEGTIIPKYNFYPIINFAGNSGGYATRPDGNMEDFLGGYPQLSDGKWHHYVMVGDLANNVVYVYIDGALVNTIEGKAYNAENKAKNPDNTEYYIESIRLDIRGSLDMDIGATLCVDNARVSVVDSWTDGDAVATPAEEKLPPIAKIDGTETSSAAEVKKALNSTTPANVEFLREFGDLITVNCDATIETNGLTLDNLIAGANVEVAKNGTVWTYDAPYKASYDKLATTDGNTIKAAVLSPVTNVANATIANVNLYANKTYEETANTKRNGDILGSGHLNSWLVTNNVTGNVYWEQENIQVDNTSNSYFEIRVMQELTYDEDVNQYFVYDFDFANLGIFDIARKYGLASVTRNPGNGGLWGDGTGITNYLHERPVGEFCHITIVMDFTNNYGYMFIDNALIAKTKNFPMSAAGYTDWVNGTIAYVNHNGLRFAQNPGISAAFDNLAVRYYAGNDSLENALDSGNITLWDANVNDADYELPTLPPIATVNGEYVYTVAELEEKLALRKSLQVEIMSDVGEILVQANAIINTNGLDVTVKVNDGASAVTDGEKVTVTVPYQVSAEFTKLNLSNSTEKSLVASSSVAQGVGLPINNGGASFIKGEHLNAWAVTNKNNGQVYTVFSGNTELGNYQDVQAGYNLQNSLTIDPDAFLVLDLDVATDSFAPNSLYITVQAYYKDEINSASKSYPFSQNVFFKDVVSSDGKWVHLTLVQDIENNKQYVYADGVLLAGYENAYAFNGTPEEVEAHGGLIMMAAKVSNTTGANNVDPNWVDEASVAFDNVSIRYYTNDESDALADALANDTITAWDEYIEGCGGYLPEIAEVDGVPYSGTGSAEAALSDDQEHDVIIARKFFGELSVDASATITTNGFENFAPADTELEVLSDGSLLVQSSIVTDNGDGTVTYARASENNLAETAAAITFVSEDMESYETIYYTFGTTIEYVGDVIDTTPRIEAGKLVATNWLWTLDLESFEDDLTGVVAAPEHEGYYAVAETKVVGNAGIKYNLSLYSNFVVNFFVPKATATTPSDKVATLDGEDYYVFEVAVDACDVADDVVFAASLTVGGTVYEGEVSVNIVKYAEKVFDNNTYSDELKTTIYAALEYANEAAKLLATAGVDVPEIAELLDIFDEFNAPDAVVDAAQDYSAISPYAHSGYLNLDAQPDFVIVLNGSYSGEVIVSYIDATGDVVAKSYEADGSDGQLLTLDTMRVYEFNSVITIQIGEAYGYYSLATYIEGLAAQEDDYAFAIALNNYAKLAKAYKDSFL